MRLISWNVNGIRAVQRKDVLPDMVFSEWLQTLDADVVCVQETKAHRSQLPNELVDTEGWNSYFSTPERKGYSGVATYTRTEPMEVSNDMGVDEFDREGRLIITRFPGMTLMNVYFPNGKASKDRLDFKMRFYAHLESMIGEMRDHGELVIVCGDVNTAHQEIDLARPKQNSKVSGFLPQEREWIDGFLASGFVDSLRVFDQAPGRYTWWDLKSRARERNVGWRIDYFFVDRALRDRLSGAFIMDEVMGSDHCPIGIDLEL